MFVTVLPQFVTYPQLNHLHYATIMNYMSKISLIQYHIPLVTVLQRKDLLNLHREHQPFQNHAPYLMGVTSHPSSALAEVVEMARLQATGDVERHTVKKDFILLSEFAEIRHGPQPIVSLKLY